MVYQDKGARIEYQVVTIIANSLLCVMENSFKRYFAIMIPVNRENTKNICP